LLTFCSMSARVSVGGVLIASWLVGGCDLYFNDSRSPGVDAGPPGVDAKPTGSTRCGRSTPDPGKSDLFKRAGYAIVATWRGTATSPFIAPYTVEIHFDKPGPDPRKGNYDAYTTDDSGVPPFYYDRNPEHSVYSLVDLHTNGDVSGEIYLEWLPNMPDVIDHLHFDDTLTHLHFSYSHFGISAVELELDCVE
jgi:hypothetical protein